MSLPVIPAMLALLLSVGAVSARQLEPPAARGWQALNQGRPGEAAEAFAAALQKNPSDPGLLVGAAAAAHLLRDTDAARVKLLDALKIDPRFTPASLMLGQLLYSSGDLHGAIAAYDDGLRYAPEHPQLVRRLEAWRKEADVHDRLNQKFGVHFTILFEGPAEAALAERAVDVLEKAYWRIGAALYFYPADVLTVVLYTREQFHDITQSPAWAGGAFDGRIRLPVQGALQNTREFDRVLAHELAHAFVRGLAGRNAPHWLNEGLAVYFEGSDPSARRDHVRRAESIIPLRRLEQSFGGLSSDDASLAYAQSAVAVQRLMEEAGAPAMVNLLTDLGAGIPLEAAFAKHMPMSYGELQKGPLNPAPSAF